MRKNVSDMAKVGRLTRFVYHSLLTQYAVKFGCDPDDVFLMDMDKVINFLEYFKETDEYNERFQDIWDKMSNG